ncbi:MAG: hypothetical protein KBG84_10705 [Planctomycetes bacterium]|nr:hypothetical protein [Planctomycetota bacterium]
MRVPAGLVKYLKDADHLDDTNRVRFQSPSVYPPLGYISCFAELDVGNGDSYGLYWPIGKENEDPIVCTTMHDGGELAPIASTVSGALQLLHFAEIQSDDAQSLAEELGLPQLRPSSQEPAGSDAISFWGKLDPMVLLELDPRSPHLLAIASRQHLAKRQCSEAEMLARKAIEVLPEYCAGHFLLARAQEAQAQSELAAAALIDAVLSPIAFDPRVWFEALRKLKSIRHDYVFEIPLFKLRKKLTGKHIEGDASDAEVFAATIDWLRAKGDWSRLLRAQVAYAEIVSNDTSTVKAKVNWSVLQYWDAVEADLEQAGYSGRLEALAK